MSKKRIWRKTITIFATTAVSITIGTSLAGEVANKPATESWQSQINQIRELITKNKIGEAENILVSIKSKIEPQSEAFFLEGRIQQEKKRNTDALGSYSIAIYLNPGMSKAWINRSLTKGALRDFEGAIQDLNTAIELDPNNPTALINRGVTFASLNQPTSAMADFNKALSIKPNSQDALHNRGIIFYLQGNNNSACQDWRRAQSLGSPETKDLVGSLCRSSNQQTKAAQSQGSQGSAGRR